MEATLGLCLALACVDAINVPNPFPQFHYDDVERVYLSLNERRSKLNDWRVYVEHHSAWRLPEIDALIKETEEVCQVWSIAAGVVGFWQSGYGDGETEEDAARRTYEGRFEYADELRALIGEENFRLGLLPWPNSWR
jgi:hypothetical protein